MYRPSAECIGWCPSGERSNIDSRRCAREIPTVVSFQIPVSSGPLCASVAIIPSVLLTISVTCCVPVSNPAIPHINREFP